MDVLVLLPESDPDPVTELLLLESFTFEFDEVVRELFISPLFVEEELLDL